jgi:hypothetical protein
MLLYALYFYVRTIPASACILRARIVAVTAIVLFSCPLAFLFIHSIAFFQLSHRCLLIGYEPKQLLPL